MARIAEINTTGKNNEKPAVSELGRKLRRISEKIAASGEKPLTRRELERELTQRRGGIR
jgi:hypothetical protein